MFRDDGLLVVGGRAEKWFNFRYDNELLVLLPYKHTISKLFAEYIHEEGGHLGVSATVSKIRSRVWITNLPKMERNIISGCITCRKAKKKL